MKNRRVGYEEQGIHVVDLSDQKNYVIRTGEEATIGSRRLRLREVNAKEEICTLEGVASGE